MPRIKRSISPFESLEDDFDEDASSSSSRNGNPPIRNAANARERARMRVLSSAFGRLKTKLPNIPPDTKLSKLDTLRLATIYIKQLQTLVECGGNNCCNNIKNEELGTKADAFNLQQTTQSMTWPFTFQNVQAASRHLSSHYASTNLDWSDVTPEVEHNKYHRYQDGQTFRDLNGSQQNHEANEMLGNNYTLNDYNHLRSRSNDNNNSRSSCMFDDDFQHQRSIQNQHYHHPHHQQNLHHFNCHTQIH